MAMLGNISDAYSLLWKMIIRPPRDKYSVDELGPDVFRIGNVVYERKDLQLKNYRGSGLSDGEYISLGHWEEQDLRVVIEHLRGPGQASAIALWGRSMGAATSVLRASREPGLAACIMDSAFGSLREVATELVTSGSVPIPSFLLSLALGVVGSEVRSRASFELEELSPAKEARFAVVPALFGVASDDNFVLPHHTMDIFKAWGGTDKKVITFGGGHNGTRPDSFREKVLDFLVDRLHKAQLPAFLADASERARQLRKIAERLEREAAGEVVQATLAGGRGGPARADERAKIAELASMGFDEGLALEALRRSSSVEGAIEWIMQQSVAAVGNLDTVAATLGAPARHTIAGDQRAVPSSSERLSASKPSRPPDAGSKAGGNAPGGYNGDSQNWGRPAAPAAKFPPARTADAPRAPVASAQDEGDAVRFADGHTGGWSAAPASGSVLEQLLQLGVAQSDAQEASRRCSSVEAAMEWLISNDKL